MNQREPTTRSLRANEFRFALVSFVLPALLLAAGLLTPLIASALDLSRVDAKLILLQTRTFAAILTRTIAFAAIAAIAASFSAWSFAIALDQLGARTRKVLLAIVVAPVVVHFLLRTYGLQILFGVRGPLNALLLATHTVRQPVQFTYSWIGTSIALTAWLLPISCLFMYVAVRHVPRQLLDAARSLGASPWTTTRLVTVAQTLPAALLILALNFTLAYGTYLSPELMGGLEDITVVRLITQMLREGRPVEAAWFGSLATAIPIAVFLALSSARKLLYKRVS